MASSKLFIRLKDLLISFCVEYSVWRISCKSPQTSLDAIDRQFSKTLQDLTDGLCYFDFENWFFWSLWFFFRMKTLRKKTQHEDGIPYSI